MSAVAIIGLAAGIGWLSTLGTWLVAHRKAAVEVVAAHALVITGLWIFPCLLAISIALDAAKSGP